MPRIESRNIHFTYNGGSVIEDVSFAVDGGETWAAIGRNGAGKSTLIKCLCGLLAPRRGAVLINGAPINRLSPREIALQIAYVPQGVNRPPPPFTVREYVTMARYPYRNYGMIAGKDDKKCVDDALDITDMSRLAGRLMGALSGGEFQAALIAGAVAQGTPFLLLDEPTTFLDPYHRENVRRMIGRIHAQRGTAVVTVTHDVNFALSTHDNILALVGGKTAFCGTKDEFCVDAVNNLTRIFSVDFGVAECYVSNCKDESI